MKRSGRVGFPTERNGAFLYKRASRYSLLWSVYKVYLSRSDRVVATKLMLRAYPKRGHVFFSAAAEWLQGRAAILERGVCQA